MSTKDPEQPASHDTKAASEPGLPVATGFIGAIVQSYEHLYRSLIFFGLLFIFLIIAFVIFLKCVGANGEFKAELKENGGLLFELRKGGLFAKEEKKTYATFLLPSNVIWFDTGLEIDPNQECKVRISGTAHLALPTLVDFTKVDNLNPVPWTKPEGDCFVNIGDSPAQLRAKKELLLKPGDTIGNVLGFLMPEDEANDFKSYFISRREQLTSKIITVNQEKVISNPTGKKSKLYLSLNDILLNFDPKYLELSKIAYGATNSEWEAKWKVIAENKYYNLYFDDNIGCLLVQVEISEKKQP